MYNIIRDNLLTEFEGSFGLTKIFIFRQEFFRLKYSFHEMALKTIFRDKGNFRQISNKSARTVAKMGKLKIFPEQLLLCGCGT